MMDFDADFAAPSDWARFYRDLGLQLVPGYLPSERPADWKRPIIKWREFETTKIPDTLFEQWYGLQGEHRLRPNMGMICGAASAGVFIVDLDTHKTDAALNWWTGLLAVHNNGMQIETPRQTTGGGGKQMLFRAPENWISPTCRTSIGVDIRGQGGFAVLAPALHASGSYYHWDDGLGPWDMEVADAPSWLCEAIDALVEEHGGSRGNVTSPRVQTTATADFDAFGNQVDGREDTMTRVVWGAVLDLRRYAPMKPGEAESMAAMKAAYDIYVRKVRTRLTHLDNEIGLETEGRGLSLFQEKWAAAMRQWDTKVAEEAAKEKPERPTEAPGEAPSPPPADEGPFPATAFVGDAPARQWVVEDWIPAGVVTSLYGDGGVGKTLLAQQLIYAAGIGGKFLGIPVPAMKALGVFCEDDRDELHRRHNAIKAHLGHPMDNPFERTMLWPRVGHDNLLVTFDRNNVPVFSAFFKALEEKVITERINLLILDNAADLFGGNEIIRAQVNFFIKAVVGRIIQKCADAGWTLSVVLLAHPSQAGRNSGTGESGSTGWNAAVRARLYLTRPDDGGTNERVLTRMKANYAASGDDTGIKLTWETGVLRVDATGGAAWPDKHTCDGILKSIDGAWRDKRPLSLAPQTKAYGRYAPKVLPKHHAVSPAMVERMIETWLENGVLTVEEANSNSGMRGLKVLVWP